MSHTIIFDNDGNIIGGSVEEGHNLAEPDHPATEITLDLDKVAEIIAPKIADILGIKPKKDHSG